MQIESAITHVYPLSEVQTAYDLATCPQTGRLKVVIDVGCTG